MGVSLSLADTLGLHDVSLGAPWVLWLDEGAFGALPERDRADLLMEQRRWGRGGVASLEDWLERAPPSDKAALEAAATGGLFVWWPSLWRVLNPSFREHVLLSFVTEDRLPCCRDALPQAQWEQLNALLPGVRPLLGTFAHESGANCLSTVLAAFGVPSVEDTWLHGEPFMRWLEGHAVQTDEMDPLGTVLVWRDAQARVQHAAVALGNGWVFHKEAQAWFAPRQVVRLEDAWAHWSSPEGTVSAYWGNR